MSKDTPEVGDVWIDKKTCFRMTFVMVSDYYCQYIEHCEKLCESFEVYQLDNIKNKSWQKGKVYLGKSKANIDDLFKTVDNGRCIEDNTPHKESTVLFKTENEE